MALTNKGKRNELNKKRGFTRPSFFISRSPARTPCHLSLLCFFSSSPKTLTPENLDPERERANQRRGRAATATVVAAAWRQWRWVTTKPNFSLFRFARMRKGETSKRRRRRRWRLIATAVFTCRRLVGSMTSPNRNPNAETLAIRLISVKGKMVVVVVLVLWRQQQGIANSSNSESNQTGQHRPSRNSRPELDPNQPSFSLESRWVISNPNLLLILKVLMFNSELPCYMLNLWLGCHNTVIWIWIGYWLSWIELVGWWLKGDIWGDSWDGDVRRELGLWN